MAIQKTEAFVLRTHPFRTSSLIVTTFSRDFGKVKGLAKGVRKEGVARPSTFEPFTLVEIVFYEKIRSELHLISEAAILETHAKLRSDLEAVATAYYLSELVDQLTEPHDPHETIFELLRFAFQLLPEISPALVARFFEIRLLGEIGLFPDLECCTGCGEKHLERVTFHIRQGGIFCPRCQTKTPGGRVVSSEALQAMRFFVSQGPREVASYTLEGEIEREIGELIDQFLTDRLGKRLQTRRFLAQVRSLRSHARSVHKA
jgi:DNA repair protein RecO (recombination protein O)